MSLLELKNINKYYKSKASEKIHVLKDINIAFDKNELVSIVGESGSGKSTLMNIIGGLDSKYSGELFVNGKNIKKLRKKELDAYRKNKIGFIFQSFNLISHLSILDNVTMTMTLSNVRKKERIKCAKEMLGELGLEEHIYKKPNQLSGGQKQRVAIARALINNPEIIIADEPTGSLDSKNSMQVLQIMRTIAEKGKLVIIVTHSEKIAACSSRVIKIEDGKIVDDKKVFQLKDETAYDDDKNKKDTFKKYGQNLNLIDGTKLALINMKEKAIRNIFVSLGASIGIMSLVLMLSFGNGIKTYFNTTMNSYVNPLVVEVNKPSEEKETVSLDIGVIQKPNINQQTPFNDDDIQQLSKIDNVSSVEKGYTEISVGVNSIGCDGKGSDVVSLSTVSSDITESNIQEGSLPKAGEILVNKAVSDKLGGDVIGKSATLHIFVNQKVITKNFVISGIYTTAGGDLTAVMKSVLLNYSDLEKWYSENNCNLKPNVVYLKTDNEKYTYTIKDKVKELGYSGSSEEEMANMFNEMINILTYVLSGISGVALIVSTIMIIIIMYISVVERTKEIGIIKAIGARGKDIRRIFICEAFLIGVLGGTIGVLAAMGAMKGINIMSNKLFHIDLVLIKNRYKIFGITLSIVISTLAGLLPANKAAKLDPVDSLRRE
jgi:ABC-type lipoprotein export system ATPase subunit/ABC-type antimicrobial peptide transport system permease subunit